MPRGGGKPESEMTPEELRQAQDAKALAKRARRPPTRQAAGPLSHLQRRHARLPGITASMTRARAAGRSSPDWM